MKEKNKIFKLYNKNTKIFPNAINIDEKKKKNPSEFYIIYSGSYHYKPNKDAIDFLNQEIMPLITKKFPKLKTCFNWWRI